MPAIRRMARSGALSLISLGVVATGCGATKDQATGDSSAWSTEPGTRW